MARGPGTRFVLLVLAACLAGALARLAPAARPDAGFEMAVERLLRLGGQGDQIVVVLAERDGARRLAVPVSDAEAALLQGALRGAPGLGATALAALGGRVLRVSIDEALSLHRFRAHLTVSSGSRELRLEASAGEALSLAVQAGADIVVDGALLEVAGVSPDDLRGKRARDLRSGGARAPVLGL